MYVYIYIYTYIHTILYTIIYTVTYILVHISMCALKIETFIQFRIRFCAAIVIGNVLDWDLGAGFRRIWNMYLTLWRPLMIKFQVSKHFKLLIQSPKKNPLRDVCSTSNIDLPIFTEKFPGPPFLRTSGARMARHLSTTLRLPGLPPFFTGGGEWSGGQNLGSWPFLWG